MGLEDEWVWENWENDWLVLIFVSCRKMISMLRLFSYSVCCFFKLLNGWMLRDNIFHEMIIVFKWMLEEALWILLVGELSVGNETPIIWLSGYLLIGTGRVPWLIINWG